jgi:predicted acetyltransferase
MDYRPVPEGHRESFRRLVSYAFDPASGPNFDLEERRERPESFEPRGLYDVDESDGGGGTADAGDGGDGPSASDGPTTDHLAAVCKIYRFTLRIRDAWRPAGGVGAVASAPETRRRGYVADMLDGLHRELRGDGTPFAVLWPFDYGFYRRLGYEQVGQYARLTVPPDELSAVAAGAADDGAFVRLDADDWAELDAVHAAWADEGLAVDRTESWWRRQVFEHWSDDPYVYGWRDDDGDLGGYVVYTFEDGDGGSDDRTLVVYELAATDERARRHCLRFLRDHDSQVGAVRLTDRVDRATALRDALDDPRAADVEVRPGPMLRAVDLPAAVAAIPFSPGAEATLVVRVVDDACPWNDGRFELTVADGSGRLEPLDDAPEGERETTDAPGSGGDPPPTADRSPDPNSDLGGDVGALSAALVGAVPVDELAARQSGRVGSDGPEDDAGSAGALWGDADAIAALAGCCPPVETYLREGF